MHFFSLLIVLDLLVILLLRRNLLLVYHNDIIVLLVSFKDEGWFFGGGRSLLQRQSNLTLVHQYLGSHIVVVGLRVCLFFAIVFLLLVLGYLLIIQIDIYRIIFVVLY